MFTGIITSTGTIESAKTRGDLHIVVGCPWADLNIGESVAVSGACLTVADILGSSFAADLSAETLSRTAPRWEAGKNVNLERSLKVGDSMSGHMVMGHVDGVATLSEVKESGDSHVLGLEAPPELAKFIAQKGSVTLDGVSLTVNKVAGSRFWVNIIPHTWRATTLCERGPGDTLNLEIDPIARYVARLLEK